MIILKTRLEVKVTVTRKWYVTLRHPKMYPHTEFGIPTSKNIGDMHWTQSRTDRLTDSVITICLPKFHISLTSRHPANGSLMNVKSIGAFCNTFDLH